MRIVYLHQYFNTPKMSGGTRSYEIARRLVDAGHHVHMITSDRTKSAELYETIEDGILVTWLPVRYSNTMRSIARVKAFLAFAFTSSLIAAQSEADVVFATSTPLTVAIPAAYARWKQKIPMVFEVRDLWPEMPIAIGALKNPISRWLARKLERFAYRSSSHVVALSPGMKAGIVATGYPESRVTVLPNACDIDRFEVDPRIGQEFRHRYDWLGERRLVVYAGTLGQINGVSYLANVAAHMATIDPEIRFLVVGSGKEESLVREHARSLGVLNKNFFMLPRMPKADIPAVLSAADICTSLFVDVKEMWSNSANKFFDALAAGRPVAINYRGWQYDLLKRKHIGLTLPARDHHQAAVQLFDHIHNSDWLSKTGQRARHTAKTQFHRDKMVNELERILHDVVRSVDSG